MHDGELDGVSWDRAETVESVIERMRASDERRTGHFFDVTFDGRMGDERRLLFTFHGYSFVEIRIDVVVCQRRKETDASRARCELGAYLRAGHVR